MKPVVLITGASSGIGYSTVVQLHSKGYKVYAAARRLEAMQSLSDKGVHLVALDLTSETSIQQCVNTIINKEQRIDVLINNAGYGCYGSVEDTNMKEAKLQFEVNLFGLAHLTQLILPYMRECKKGKIINVSSIAGKIYMPFGAWYHASKHALEGWSDCLRIELKPFNIKVVIIEPGGIKTPWGLIAAEHLRKISGKTAYALFANRMANYFSKNYTNNKMSSPDIVANTIVKVVLSASPKTRYVKGYMGRLTLLGRKYLPDTYFDKLISYWFGVKF